MITKKATKTSKSILKIGKDATASTVNSMAAASTPLTNTNTNARRPKKGERNYYENFDFFFKRTAFRTMTLYFKLAYKPYFDELMSAPKKQQVIRPTAEAVRENLITFTNVEFPGLLASLSTRNRDEFIELLKLLVLSHRHNRNDEFLQAPQVSFDTVRDTMYKYSKQAQDKFFAVAPYSFLFHWFTASVAGKKFAAVKFAENTDERHSIRM